MTIGSQDPAAVHCCCWLDVLVNFRYAVALIRSEALLPGLPQLAGGEPSPQGPLSCGMWGAGLERDALSKLTLGTPGGERAARWGMRV